MLNGGKRIRPILCLATAESCKGTKQDTLPAALAVELFHCSTLIHDDLPCMDDDDYYPQDSVRERVTTMIKNNKKQQTTRK